MNDVFVLGSFVVDTAYRAARLPSWGETLLGSSFALGPGGKGSNQAVAAARAGAQVAFLTKIGLDPFGDIGRRLWTDEGIDTGAILTSPMSTGSAAILLDERTGANAIIVVPGVCGMLTVSEVEDAAPKISTSRVFLAQLEVPLPAVQRGLEIARGAGVSTVLNPAPAQVLTSELLGLVDFLIPNETEAAHLTGMPVNSDAATAQAAHRLQAMGAGQVILTLGERGAVLCHGDGALTPIPAVHYGPVLDTTGAGDSFSGAFAAALASGKQPVDAAHFAAAAAGISVTRAGTAPAMAHRAEIDAALTRSPR